MLCRKVIVIFETSILSLWRRKWNPIISACPEFRACRIKIMKCNKFRPSALWLDWERWVCIERPGVQAIKKGMKEKWRRLNNLWTLCIIAQATIADGVSHAIYLKGTRSLYLSLSLFLQRPWQQNEHFHLFPGNSVIYPRTGLCRSNAFAHTRTPANTTNRRS